MASDLVSSSELVHYLVSERLREQEREHVARIEEQQAALGKERRDLEIVRATLERVHVKRLEYLRAELAQERSAREEIQGTVIQMVEDVVIARFPAAPPTLATAIREVRDPQRLRDLHAAVLRAPDLETVERLLQAG